MGAKILLDRASQLPSVAQFVCLNPDQLGMLAREQAESLFLENLGQIARIIAALCRRSGIWGDEADDFASWAKVRLLEEDYARIRKYRGESSIATYLSVVLAMLHREYCVHRWGRWRPSAAAQRAGPLAVRLETLVRRDRLPLLQAGELLRTNGETTLSDRSLATLLASLPTRQPLRPLDVGDSALVRQEAATRADGDVDEQDDRDERDSTFRLLAQTIDELPTEDRLAIQLHYWSEMSIADISRTLGVAQKPLYRRLHRAMLRLRKRLEAAGVSRELVREIAGKLAS